MNYVVFSTIFDLFRRLKGKYIADGHLGVHQDLVRFTEDWHKDPASVS